MVTSLRNTITGLREASNVEGRLKSDLMQVQEQLAAANAALVSQGLICDPWHTGAGITCPDRGVAQVLQQCCKDGCGVTTCCMCLGKLAAATIERVLHVCIAASTFS